MKSLINYVRENIGNTLKQGYEFIRGLDRGALRKAGRVGLAGLVIAGSLISGRVYADDITIEQIETELNREYESKERALKIEYAVKRRELQREHESRLEKAKQMSDLSVDENGQEYYIDKHNVKVIVKEEGSEYKVDPNTGMELFVGAPTATTVGLVGLIAGLGALGAGFAIRRIPRRDQNWFS